MRSVAFLAFLVFSVFSFRLSAEVAKPDEAKFEKDLIASLVKKDLTEIVDLIRANGDELIVLDFLPEGAKSRVGAKVKNNVALELVKYLSEDPDQILRFGLEKEVAAHLYFPDPSRVPKKRDAEIHKAIKKIEFKLVLVARQDANKWDIVHWYVTGQLLKSRNFGGLIKDKAALNLRRDNALAADAAAKTAGSVEDRKKAVLEHTVVTVDITEALLLMVSAYPPSSKRALDLIQADAGKLGFSNRELAEMKSNHERLEKRTALDLEIVKEIVVMFDGSKKEMKSIGMEFPEAAEEKVLHMKKYLNLK